MLLLLLNSSTNYVSSGGDLTKSAATAARDRAREIANRCERIKLLEPETQTRWLNSAAPRCARFDDRIGSICGSKTFTPGRTKPSLASAPIASGA